MSVLEQDVPTTPDGAFEPRLPASVLLELQERVRARLAADGLDAVVSDDPEDVAYLTGFFHHPCERPVAVWLDADGVTLLLPELEREHAEAQHAQAASRSTASSPSSASPGWRSRTRSAPPRRA